MKSPDGLRFARTGVLSAIGPKSSMVRSILADRAMASRCKTALVEPPRTLVNTIALRKDCLVRMSLYE